VATGGRELSHFWWRSDLEMWKVWAMLGGFDEARASPERGGLLLVHGSGWFPTFCSSVIWNEAWRAVV
jgi:hypothetical protein